MAVRVSAAEAVRRVGKDAPEAERGAAVVGLLLGLAEEADLVGVAAGAACQGAAQQ